MPDGLDYTHRVLNQRGATTYHRFADDTAALEYAERNAYVTWVVRADGSLLYERSPLN